MLQLNAQRDFQKSIFGIENLQISCKGADVEGNHQKYEVRKHFVAIIIKIQGYQIENL